MSEPSQDLARKNCLPCEAGVPPMTMAQIHQMLKSVLGWEYKGEAGAKAFPVQKSL